MAVGLCARVFGSEEVNYKVVSAIPVNNQINRGDRAWNVRVLCRPTFLWFLPSVTREFLVEPGELGGVYEHSLGLEPVSPFEAGRIRNVLSRHLLDNFDLLVEGEKVVRRLGPTEEAKIRSIQMIRDEKRGRK